MRALLAILLMFFINFASNAASPCEGFVKSFIERAQQKPSVKNYREYLFEVVDLKYITKYSLSSTWNKLSPQQRKDFYDIYSEYIVSKYANLFARHPALDYKILSAANDEKIPGICNVSVTIKTLVNNEKKDFPLRALIFEKDSKFYIRDINFENISILQNHRQEVESLISSKGFDGTIQALKDLVAAQK